MKIVDERKPTATRFKDVNISQVFYIENEQEYGDYPYMRIFAINDYDDCKLNAVDLQSGLTVAIEDDELIIPCDAVLNIY